MENKISSQIIMEKFSDEEEDKQKQPLLQTPINNSAKGGFTTLPFILGTLAFVGMASSAVVADMIKYMMGECHMSAVSASNFIYFWYAFTYIVPLTGAFLADSLLGRFHVIAFGCVIGLVGMILLWLPNVIPQAKPPPCNNNYCSSRTAFQLIILCISLVMLSLGTGGILSSLLAFGVDQLKHLQKNVGAKESYFSWYFAIFAICEVVGLTCLVYIQENIGWGIGYGVTVVLMLFANLSFFLGHSFYVKESAKKSLVPGLLQVIVASCKNRNLKVNNDISYLHKSGTTSYPSERFRFLNNACTIQDPQKDINSDGTPTNPWSLCTVEQVEELKSVIKVIPIWFTGVLMAMTVTQASFAVLQATMLDRRVGSSFEIPAGSVGLFGVLSSAVWIVFYDRVILPLASWVRGKDVHFGPKFRMGFGIFVSFWYVVVVAVVENIRRRLAIKEGVVSDDRDQYDGTVHMSILWVVPQNVLYGIAVGSNAVAQNQFYISEFPSTMPTIASSLYALGFSLGNVFSSLLVSCINELSTRGGKDSWISSNINKGHYDYFYWVLVGLSFVNFFLFLIFSRAYGPCKDEKLGPVIDDE